MNEKECKQYEKLILRPVDRLIATLAVPTVISMLTTMIYNLVDAYFVGKLGTSASAAIGILISVHAVFQAIGFMFGQGSGSGIAVLLGQGKHEVAGRIGSTGFAWCLGFASIVSVLELLFLSPLLEFLGSTQTILPYAKSYGIYIVLAGPVMAGSCVLNNIIRYEGKAVYAMVGLVTGGVLNMILDPIFMFKLDMGIAGAGLATALSQCASFGLLLFMFKSGKTITKLQFRYISLRFDELFWIIRRGLPSLSRQMLNSISSAALNICAKPYGDPAIAAMAIVGRIAMFIGSVMIGIGQGFQPVSGYNYGAKKYRRLRKGFFFTWRMGEALLSCLAVLAFFFPEPVVRLFRDDIEVVKIGVPALRFQCLALILQPFSICSNMLFQAIGKTKEALFLSMLRSGLCYIPVILILPQFIGITGIESAQAIADVLTVAITVPFTIRFFKSIPQQDEEAPIDLAYRLAKENGNDS
ncbi:MAG: MATE family efflux transporter [Lachnospiraceae bacterium]|nr:MATE family efflux transporter [Lachnospiraceae bacterium]